MNGYDLTTPDYDAPLPDEVLRRAALAVCARAVDTDDARELLAALGLLR